MGRKKGSQALKKESNVGEVRIERVWSEGMMITDKDQGSSVLYDEPSRELDPANHDTWPPRYVVLSSLWAFKVVKEENIPQAVRYKNWPTTFNSKSGFQSSWKNRGRPALIRDEEGTIKYPVVFGTMQLHGTEGEREGLQSTPTTTNVRPHNKHSYTFGDSKPSTTKQQLTAPLLKSSLKQTPQPREQPPMQHPNTQVEDFSAFAQDDPGPPHNLIFSRADGKTFKMNSNGDSPYTIPPQKRKREDALTKSSSKRKKPTSTLKPSIENPYNLVGDQNTTPSTFRMKPPAAPLKLGNSSTQKIGLSTAEPSIENPYNLVGDQNTTPSTFRMKPPAAPLKLGSSSTQKKGLSTAEPSIENPYSLVGDQNTTTSTFDGEPSTTPRKLFESSSSRKKGMSTGIKEEDNTRLTASPQHSDSNSDEDGSDSDSDIYGRLKGELADLKRDHFDLLENNTEQEHTLLKADGKVMLLSGVLRQAYNAISQLNQGLSSSARMAKSLQEYKDLPATTRKEADDVLACRKATGFSIKAFNEALESMLRCFPGTARVISKSGDELDAWIDDKTGLPGGKAIEEGDKMINGKGEIFSEDES